MTLTHTEALPTGLWGAVTSLAEQLGTDADAVLHAAHTRVVAALAGDADVADRSWEDLVREAAKTTDVPEPDGWTLEWTADALRVTGRPADTARIAGYHLAALTGAVADPSARSGATQLLSSDELALQLRGMGGRVRPLPDVRAHHLIEQHARTHPNLVAAVCGTHRLTYAELDARANHVAHALVSRGVSGEDVVAVVTERNLDWLVCVLAIFKAGATYLPIEPHFPAERIGTTLRRAGCVLALTEPASRDHLDAAGPSHPVVTVAQLLAEPQPQHAPGVEVPPGHRAYIYFTSGSTGEPKGAMCEHAGMLNHLLAKIEDLGIGPGDVVAQTAPQCFDISLWQLIGALLVGGTTVIVEQDVVLDAGRMVDTLGAQRVAVLQVVPSYLEVVMTHLERHPAALPELRVVSVTGEAVKHELVERWFALRPGVALVNAYGLTETSDDTNHAVLHAAPADGRVPLGPPIRNVTVYVVDPDLNPVPLGAPGEIVFSGVCVGRGYVNDPERTAAAFVPDPHVPGARLYRSGDFGRWRADGSLEFLGRRDTQLKISGFRIEIGEIENRLLTADGVRDAAVVVVERGGSKHLVGFYDADTPLDGETLREHLGATLPHYMVPRTLHHRRPLPLTGNGKVDRKALTRIAGELDTAATDRRAPATPAERRVAAAWADVLQVDAGGVSANDDFFDLGGTSLLAVKLVIRLERAVSLRQIGEHRVLADLARLLDASESDAPGGKETP